MPLSIANNAFFNSGYSNMLKSLRGLDKSTQRLTTGLKAPTAADGVGTLGLASTLKTRINGLQERTNSIQNAVGFTAVRNEYLVNARNLLDRVTELAQAAEDPLKTDADLAVLDAEMQGIELELRSYETATYNTLSVFGASFDILLDVDNTSTYNVDQIDFTGITLTGLNILSNAAATSVLNSISGNFAVSLDTLIAKGGQQTAYLQRVIDTNVTYAGHLQNVQAGVNNIDVAQELSEFTSQQLRANVAESILAQTIDIHAGLVSRFI